MGLESFRKAGRFFAKATTTELERLQALLARQERTVQAAFADFLRSTRSDDVLAQISDRLERGDVEGALAIIDGFITRMGSTAIPTIFQAAAQAEAATLAPALAELKPAVAIVFDPTDAAAAQAMREATLRFIREFTDDQRAATRNALAEAFTSGAGIQDATRAFRDSIGLTEFQERTVANYRRLLEEGSSEALQRKLRDRRFDGSVRRASKTGDPIPKETVDRMVERYRDRLRAKRAEDIARTEGVRVTEEAREVSFRQTMDAAGIQDSEVEQFWRSVGDNRTRHTHKKMNGQRQPLGTPFKSPSGASIRYPGDPQAPASEVIGCRCHRTFKIKGIGSPR